MNSSQRTSDTGPTGSAYDAAVRMLGLREHSRFELADKLSRKGFPEDESREALNRLVEQRYVDDARYAEMVMRHHGTLGRAGLVQQMRRRGIAPAIYGPLVDGVGREEELERALAAASRRSTPVPAGRVEREKWRRRTSSFLMRRGFAQPVVIAVLSQLSEQAGVGGGDWVESP